MEMTVIELLQMLTDKIATDPTWSTADVKVDGLAITNYHTGEVITLVDDDEDESYDYEPDVDESNYDPYMGCDFYECDYGDF